MRSNGGNSVSSAVDGVSDSNEITKLFADKYEDLYACVSYDEGQMTALRTEIDSMVNSTNSAQESNVSCVDVLGGSVAEWLACRTQARKSTGSNRSRDAVE